MSDQIQAELAKRRRQEDIIAEVLHERVRQDRQWGGPEHDDTHSADDFAMFIRRQANRLHEDPRGRMVKIAALAVAAVEMLDRELER